jgi:glucose/arabinose dehydrogenase
VTRRVLASIAISALALAALVALPGAAVAHDGVDHGTEPGAAAALDWGDYEKVTLTKDIGEPIDLAVLPDGRVLHTARNGVVRLTTPDTGVTKVAGTFDVYNNSEDGLQTVTLDPDFATNHWVYVYYAPRVMTSPYPATTPTGSAPNTLPAGADASYWNQWKGYNQLARVKWDEASDSLDLSTQQVIIKVETQRGQCCHVAGDVDFDGAGHLYLATGDNTPASAPGANGFAPNNDAPGFNPGFDSRRGAGNTNDLRGKILRISVQDDGSYTVPAGNLYLAGTANTRPEIFVQGVRNPFRIDVDQETGSVSWGDYGPDAGVADAQRGPMGLVEWNTTGLTQPMNSGWPYCTGNNFNYNQWNYETATPGPFFDCAAGAQNNSRWNTGLATLPPAVPADLYYGDDADDQPWPELTDFEPAGGQGPMGGPVYHYDAANPSPTKFPEYWDNKAFFAEFSQDYLAAFTVAWPDGPVSHIEQFLPNDDLSSHGQPITDSPMDIEFGPDGSLYVLDYGDGFFRANPDAGLYRIDYAPGNKAPQAKISANPISGSSAPLAVTFNGSASADPEGGALTYEWDFDGNGTFDATGVTASHTYTALGAYTARLRVTDPQGRRGLISTTISVGNVAPTVTVATPANGAFFNWGDRVPFTVTTADPEDGTATTCSRVSWTFGLGHDVHAHPLSQGTGCTFTIPTPADAQEHGVTENIFGVVVIRYTDNAVNGVPAATGEVSLILNPREQQAEWADTLHGVEVVDDAAASGLRKVTSFDPGDYLAWDPVNLAGIGEVRVRASGTGTLALRWGSATAAPFATVPVDSAAPVNLDRTLVEAPTGTGELFVTSSGGVVVDSLLFGGDGVVDTTAPAVTIAGVTADAALGDSGVLKPTWSATDASGIESVTATLDGSALKAATTVELWRLPLGAHTLAVTATDKAGLKTTQTVGFRTVTSFRDVSTLIEKFRKDKQVTTVGSVLLQAQLLEAKLLDAQGRTKSAVAALNRFRASAGLKAVVKDSTVAAALKRDAADLIVQVQQ